MSKQIRPDRPSKWKGNSMHHQESTRRQFLGATGLATLGLATTVTSMSNAEEKKSFLKLDIDAHSHIWTRDIKNFPLNKGATLKDLAPPSFTSEELLKVIAANRVGRVVLIQHHTFHGFDNGYLIDAANRYPGRFKIVGMVDDRKPHPDVVMKKLLKKHVTGFRITPRINKDKWLTGPGMAAMWKCGAETGQAMCCLIDAKDLASVDHMCGHFPDTPVVIDHFARIGVDGQMRKKDIDSLCHLARHKRTAVKISAYYALGKKRPPYTDLIPMIRRLLDSFGPERLMWASDSPYQIDGPNTYEASLALVRERLDFLSNADREKLLRTTAERVFFS